MTEKNYFLNIYNTMTGEFELVQVTVSVGSSRPRFVGSNEPLFVGKPEANR